MEKAQVQLALNQWVILRIIARFQKKVEADEENKDTSSNVGDFKKQAMMYTSPTLEKTVTSSTILTAVRKALRIERKKNALQIANAVLTERCAHLETIIELWKMNVNQDTPNLATLKRKKSQ